MLNAREDMSQQMGIQSVPAATQSEQVQGFDLNRTRTIRALLERRISSSLSETVQLPNELREQGGAAWQTHNLSQQV